MHVLVEILPPSCPPACLPAFLRVLNIRKSVHVSLLHNPSHLEIVGSVAAGKARAKRRDGSSAMAVQVKLFC